MFKTNKLFVILFIISTILLIPFSGCSFAPNDDYLTARISDDLGYGNPMLAGMWPTNVSVISKGKCDQLSTTAKAAGISEAWIIGYQYDHDDGYYNDGVGLYTVKNGQEISKIRGYSCP